MLLPGWGVIAIYFGDFPADSRQVVLSGAVIRRTWGHLYQQDAPVSFIWYSASPVYQRRLRDSRCCSELLGHTKSDKYFLKYGVKVLTVTVKVFILLNFSCFMPKLIRLLGLANSFLLPLLQKYGILGISAEQPLSLQVLACETSEITS
jgi:hypothetical protein